VVNASGRGFLARVCAAGVGVAATSSIAQGQAVTAPAMPLPLPPTDDLAREHAAAHRLTDIFEERAARRHRRGRLRAPD